MEPLVLKEIIFPYNLWGGIVFTNNLALIRACGVDLLFPGYGCDAIFSDGHGCICMTLEVIVDAVSLINPPVYDIEVVGVYHEAYITGTIQVL